jgi:hypothetical protein
LPAVVDRAALVVDEARGQAHLLHDVERQIRLDPGSLLRPGDPEPVRRVEVRASKRRSSSSRLVVRRTTTPTPGFAPNFVESTLPE